MDELDGKVTAGRKGVPFDWHQIVVDGAVARLEEELRDLQPAVDAQ